MKTEHALDVEVRRLLDLHRGRWRDIAIASDVSYSWLSKFARGTIRNPGYATLRRLHAYLIDKSASRSVRPLTSLQSAASTNAIGETESA